MVPMATEWHIYDDYICNSCRRCTGYKSCERVLLDVLVCDASIELLPSVCLRPQSSPQPPHATTTCHYLSTPQACQPPPVGARALLVHWLRGSCATECSILRTCVPVTKLHSSSHHTAKCNFLYQKVSFLHETTESFKDIAFTERADSTIT
ncbi:hypothetical protein C0Q70_21357 [Pomacea canaliculata]|uniref:Uncharacterized protein n=1 Tax=Pomacea canaliculata TaxID=400727 RepID=A0A2T7NCA1_POMCA|nr:hypothetical protein C0Q70_21357 [Pomacea canaliculata]